LENHITFCLDWFVVQQRGLIAPFVDGPYDRGNQVGGAVDRPYVFDATVGGYGSVDANGADLALGLLGIDAGDQFTDHHFLVAIERPPRVFWGHANGTLDVDGNRG